jgi:nitrite reductase/ring-hydroxylating ferredoxin subunit
VKKATRKKAREPRANRLVRVASREDFARTPLLNIMLDGKALLLCRVAGEYYAVSGTCTHQDWPLCEGHIVGTQIVCPLHGREFELKTGKCVQFPATNPLRTYRVTEREGGIYIDKSEHDASP